MKLADWATNGSAEVPAKVASLALQHGNAIRGGMGWRKLGRLADVSERQARAAIRLARGQTPHPIPGAGDTSVADPGPITQALESPRADAYMSDKAGHYNTVTDTYLTIISACPKPLLIPGPTHRAMLQAYSNWDGAPASINQLCREFSMPRQWLTAYLRVWGITHDSEPFTQEEVADGNLDDMVETALQMRRQALHRKYETAKWSEIQKDAQKWNNFHEEALMAIREVVPPEVGDTPPPAAVSTEPYAMVLGLTDFHFGMYAWGAESRDAYDLAEARHRLDTYVDDVVSETIVAYGSPEKIILTCGSDFFHVDGDQAFTTKGTPQDVCATPTQILVQGCELNDLLIRKLLGVGCKVELVLLMSNHGRSNDLALLLYLTARYQDHPMVEVVSTCEPRAYVEYGDSALVFHHGDKLKPRGIVDCFAVEEPELWGRAGSRYVFAGHLHKTEMEEIGGALCCLMPSLAGNDRFHVRAGYVTSRPGIAGYRITKDRGMRSFLFSGVQTTTGLLRGKKRVEHK